MVRLANRRSLFVGVAALFVCLTAVAQENASWSEQKIGNLWSGGTPVWSSATAAGRSLIDAQVAAWQIQYGKQLTPQTALSCSDFGNDQGSCSQTYTWVNDCCGPPNPIVTAPFGVRIYAWCQQSSIGNDRYGIQTGNLTYTCPREGGPCSVYPANSTFGCGKTVTDLQNIAKAATDPTRIFHATQTCIAKKSCDLRCQMDNCKWMDHVIPDFVNPYLTKSGNWNQVESACQTSTAIGWEKDVLCAQSMAWNHIFSDLFPALVTSGCGSSADWDKVFGVIKECTAANVPTSTNPVTALAPAVSSVAVWAYRTIARTKCVSSRGSSGLPSDINDLLRGKTCDQ